MHGAMRRMAARAERDGILADAYEPVLDSAEAKALQAFLSELPEPSRSVVDLVARGHSVAEAATQLQLTSRQAESHLYRARRHLRLQVASL